LRCQRNFGNCGRNLRPGSLRAGICCLMLARNECEFTPRTEET